MAIGVQERALQQQYLTEEEELLVQKIGEWLKTENPADYSLIEERFGCLRALGAAVFSYRSIRDTELFRGISCDGERLADALLTFSSPSHLLHMPTKVVALRGFLVAKFHAFSLLSYIVGVHSEYYAQLRNVIISVICTLIAEDVYFSCLADPAFSRNTKLNISNDLLSLWDSGIAPRGIRYLSDLSALWIARDAAPPSFGTMDGNTELLRISIDMEHDWQEFLVQESDNDQTRWAMEEFLFGLSYEEIRQIRARLNRFGVTAIGYNEIRSYLGTKPAYSLVNDRDPRAIFDFFIERRNACANRKHISAPGPRYTLEEIYIKYRIVLEVR